MVDYSPRRKEQHSKQNWIAKQQRLGELTVKEDPELRFSAAICRNISTWAMSENVWMQKNAVVKSDENISVSEQ